VDPVPLVMPRQNPERERCSKCQSVLKPNRIGILYCPKCSEIIATYLKSAKGRARFNKIVQEEAAIVADENPEGSFLWHLGRALAGLPPSKQPIRWRKRPPKA